MPKKSRRKKNRSGTCTYCGVVGRVTQDHIPPRLLFPKGFTPPSVPACRSCNNGASSNDEHLRAALALRAEVAQNVTVKELLPTIMRGLLYTGTKGNTGQIVRSMTQTPTVSRSGIYLGMLPTYTPDEEAMARVIGRIVRGLHFLIYSERIADHSGVSVFLAKNIDPLVLNLTKLKQLSDFANAGTLGVIHEDVFMYSTNRPPDNLESSVWTMVFYRYTSVLCAVIPRKEVTHGGQLF